MVNNHVLVVDRGVPVNVNGIPAVVLARERDRLQELKQGRYALAPRQAGFARLDECLLYKDNAGGYHYIYSNNPRPVLVTDAWDLGFIWNPDVPEPSDPSISLVKRTWNLANPGKPDMSLKLSFPSSPDMDLLQIAWDLG